MKSQPFSIYYEKFWLIVYHEWTKIGEQISRELLLINTWLTQYFRCPERYIRVASKEPLSTKSGYFQFGNETTCYGSYYKCQVAEFPTGVLHDATADIEIRDRTAYLPFDPSQVADNLLRERYVDDWRNKAVMSALAKAYYVIRPILSVRVRKHLQKIYLMGWDKLPFPRWPLDCSVDNLLRQLLLLSLNSNGEVPIPFVWFWPEGASSCAIMTHDVETEPGRDFCPTLMDIDDSYGIKASFQVIPEQRYHVSRDYLRSIRERGFEVVIHDLNHDGHLYRNREQFFERAAKINSYGKEYGAEGFRAAVLYRKQLWYEALNFSYDMSVPNVAHLDPQRGGCCTVMPYFIGEILELPVTTTQDYTLFHILNDYSIDLWKRQIELIMEKHGLMSFIVHSDYIIGSRERAIFEVLLGFLARLKEEKGVWITTPGEVNRWWRQRAEMRLVENGEGWQIDGPSKERARIAYASKKEGRLVFSLSAVADQENFAMS